MSRKMLLIAALLLILLGVYFLKRSHRPRTQRVGVQGALAPDFSLSQLSGEPLQLSAYRGKVVLLDFWATWCDPCREEIPRFVELQNKYGQRGLQIIGVSMDDSPEPVRDFYQRFKMNYPVVMGNAKIGELYGGVFGLPIAFVIGQDGRIYRKHIGVTDISVLETEVVNLLAGRSVSLISKRMRLSVQCTAYAARSDLTPPSKLNLVTFASTGTGPANDLAWP